MFTIMRKGAFLLLATMLASTVMAQNPVAFQFYNAKGKKADFKDIIKSTEEADVLLFGEYHNSSICHWLQLELTASLGEKRDLVLGAEMFETDDQIVVNEYLADFIKLDHLKKEAKVWPNFETDYLPLVEYAKANKLPFIATNVPRRYASLVSKKGIAALDSLSEAAKSLMPKLPYEVTINDPGYIEMREMMGMHMQHGIDNFIAAQALKDYTMAHNIYQNLPEKGLFIHYNGSFHSQNFAGIYNYLKNLNQDLNINTIAIVEGDVNEYNEEWNGLGDFILVVPENMTKTH